MEQRFEQLHQALEKEKQDLLNELKELAPHPEGEGGESEFRDETADRLEDQEDRAAETLTLKTRLNEVTAALGRLEEGKFGTCAICGKEIETDRLEANPAAKTCKEHLE